MTLDNPLILWALCQCSNGLFPIPLPCLRRSDEGVPVVDIHDARVLCDIRYFQKHLAALVDGDSLEMTEGITYKINRGTLLRQGVCAFFGKNHANCVEE